MVEPWVTVAEIAEALQVSEGTVRAWLRAGQLHGRQFGGRVGWRVRAGGVPGGDAGPRAGGSGGRLRARPR
jgi:excisionase family DNA binding protein